MSLELLPAEKVALTVALAQILRGEAPGPNTASMCVLALARLDGRHDWRKEDDKRERDDTLDPEED